MSSLMCSANSEINADIHPVLPENLHGTRVPMSSLKVTLLLPWRRLACLSLDEITVRGMPG